MKFNEDREKSSGLRKPGTKWVIIMATVLVVLIGYAIVVNNNIAGHYVMIEPLSGSGKFQPIMEPGRYPIWFNKAHVWDKSATYWFSVENNEGNSRDESVPVRYNDGGTAKVSGSVRYTIGMDKEKFIKLHIQYRNQENFQDRAIGALVKEVLTLTATLMSAEESYTTTKAQFTQWALDQLNHGVYLTETYIDTVTLPTGEVRFTRRSKLRNDPKTGVILRKEYALADFDVHFSQFVVSDPDYHQKIKDQIAGKLDNLMGKVASQAEGELKNAQEVTATAVGKRNVVKAEYKQKVINVVDIITAQINADTSRIMAEAKKEVSSILKQAAEFQRDANIFNGEGEASYKRALQSADSNMEIRLKLWLQSHKDRASIIAANGAIYPIWIQPSGSAAETGLDILNYNAVRQMQMAQKK